MKARRAGRAVAVLAAVCGAGLGNTWAAAAAQPVAWGTTVSAPGARAELFGVAAGSSSDRSGGFAVGGLPDGSYTVTASLPGCQPGVATATVTAGRATAVNAHITCPP